MPSAALAGSCGNTSVVGTQAPALAAPLAVFFFLTVQWESQWLQSFSILTPRALCSFPSHQYLKTVGHDVSCGSGATFLAIVGDLGSAVREAPFKEVWTLSSD